MSFMVAVYEHSLLLVTVFIIYLFIVLLAGHFVQGHVDCTGDIIEKFQEGDSLWFKVSYNDYHLNPLALI